MFPSNVSARYMTVLFKKKFPLTKYKCLRTPNNLSIYVGVHIIFEISPFFCFWDSTFGGIIQMSSTLHIDYFTILLLWAVSHMFRVIFSTHCRWEGGLSCLKVHRGMDLGAMILTRLSLWTSADWNMGVPWQWDI